MPKLTLSIVLVLAFYQRPQLSVNQPVPELSALARQANAAMRAGDLRKAENLHREGLLRSRRIANWRYVSGFLTSLGVIRVNQARYRQALEFFVEGQDAARQANAPTEVALAASNIGVIFARLGDWHKAHAAIIEATRGMAPADLPSTLHLNLANYESRRRRYAVADSYFRTSIDNSERLAHLSLVAASWEHWGLSYLERGDLEPAEQCLLESYRQHRLAQRPDSEQLHYGLARLALARGDFAEARRRAAQYLRAARAAPLLYPLWEAYRVAAEIEERAGNLPLAYDRYSRGVDWARRSRAERLPSAQLMATAESALQSLYLGLIRTAQAMHLRRPNIKILLQALEGAEEGRNAALAENRALLTDEYWQTLDRLQRLQARRLVQDTPQFARESEQLRTRLLNFESLAGLRSTANGTAEQLIAQARRALAADESIQVFRTGEPYSYAWTITPNHLSLRRLAGEKILAARVAHFRADILSGRALHSDDGRLLFSEIFGELSLSENTNKRWTLVPDGPLHELPFAALPWPTRRGSATYLVEHRSLLSAPSIATLASEPQPATTHPTFVGIADPIYNSADPRLLSGSRPSLTSTFELARLPGSQSELDMAVRILQPPNPILLTGTRVNRNAFLELLEHRAETLHLATHVVAEPGNPRHALIALGLNPLTRQQDLVGAEDINARPHSARLVVMSGCSSGRGEIVPGAGLLSLTRAWILSGAAGVIGSHWPVPDTSGVLFERFYRFTRALRRPNSVANAGDWALALQHAQIESIHERIPASVWAAYFLTGRN
jgi:hypothetical protein